MNRRFLTLAAWAALRAATHAAQAAEVGGVAAKSADSLAVREAGVINVEDFGAVGDGSTDNSGAVSQAVTACAAAGGCTLFFGSATGGHFILGGVRIAASHVTVACQNGVTLINNSPDSYAIEFGGASVEFYQDAIRDCTFGQKSGAPARAGNVALALDNLGEMNVERVTIKPYPAAPYVGLRASRLNQSIIDKLYVAGMLNSGVEIFASGATSGGDIFLTNAQSNSNGADGFDLADDGGVYAVNNSAYGNVDHAWHIHKISFGNINFLIVNCIGDTSGSHNWQIESLNNGQFENVWGSTQLSASRNTFSTGFMFSGPDVQNIVMTNPTAIYNNSNGIEIHDADGLPRNISILNPIAGSGSHGNGRSGAGFGISVDRGASAISILGGMALHNASGPLSLGAGSTVRVNSLQGYSAAPVSCRGAPTVSFAVDQGVVTHC